MVKLNILGSIFIFMALSAVFFYHSQTPKSVNLEKKQIQSLSNSSFQAEETESLKKQFEEIQLKNNQLQEENLNLVKQNTELKAEKNKLEESKIQVEETNKKITEEITTLKEAGPQRRRRDPNGSPYRVSPDSTSEERRPDRAEGRQRWREMASLQNISKISTLTNQQKEYFEVLQEDFKEFQIRMIRNEEKLSREETRAAWGEQMNSYRENVFKNLTPEQVEELNKVTEEQIKEREQFSNRERE